MDSVYLVYNFKKGWFLYILFITSNIRSITMFVSVDLQSMFYT